MEPAHDTTEKEGGTTVYETTIAVVSEPPGMLAPDPNDAAPLAAHHKMLHEGSILSSHFKTYQHAITKYISSASKFMHAADDFILSAGQPTKYEHKLTPEGQAAAAAAAELAAAPAGTEDAAALSAFSADAAQPSTLPLQGPVAGYYICPSMPGSPALGAAGLTHTAPADILLPRQHEALFRHDMQRKLIGSGSDTLTAALQEKLAPAFKVWLGVYDECKVLLPEVERLRRDADAALNRLQEAKDKVLKAEASSPLVSGQQLQDAGQMPRVLVQGTAAGLVATPAAQERQEMYHKETEYTDASLAFELAEKVLRDKLGWLMQAGAGLKGTAVAALGHALVAVAAEGQPGQAAGGTAAGGSGLRAAREELLEPFPAHVLARLSGQHLPTLQQVVLADAQRLARWGQRCRGAIAAAAGAAAAAAGAQMLAAAAAPAGAATALPGAGDVVPPAGALHGFARTDDAPAQQAGVAAAEASTTAGSIGGMGGPDSLTAAATAAASPTAAGREGGATAPAGIGAATGLVGELQAVAAASDVPLELLAAAVSADVQEGEAAEAAAGRDDAAWHLLHDASVVAAKEEAVLLPAVLEHLGGEAAARLQAQHQALAAALSNLGQQSPAAATFDLALVEVLEVVDDHLQELETNILPGLAAAPSLQLRTNHDLAKQYRRSATAAPTRPHGWFLGAPDAASACTADGGAAAAGGVRGAASAAVAAAKQALRRVAAAPVRAGVAALDAAADVARFGHGKVPEKL